MAGTMRPRRKTRENVHGQHGSSAFKANVVLSNGRRRESVEIGDEPRVFIGMVSNGRNNEKYEMKSNGWPVSVCVR